MTSRIEQLERLMRIRASGTLTEAEFLAEKSRILEQDPGNAPTELIAAKGRPIWRWPLLIAVGLSAVAGFGVVIAQYVNTAPVNDVSETATAPAQTAQAKAASAAAPSLRDLPMDQQYALALKAVFGGGKPEFRGADGSSYKYGKGQLIWASHAIILVLPGSHQDPSPVASGILGIFYLKEKSGAFEVAKRWPDAVGGSMMGNAPEWRISDEFGVLPIVVSETSGVWQGYSCGGTLLTELAPSGPKDLAGFDTHYSNGGAAPDGELAQTVDGKIINIVKNKSFEVRFSGTQGFTHRYVRDGERYVRSHGDDKSRIPTC